MSLAEAKAIPRLACTLARVTPNMFSALMWGEALVLPIPIGVMLSPRNFELLRLSCRKADPHQCESIIESQTFALKAIAEG